MAVPTEFAEMSPLDVFQHDLELVSPDSLRAVLLRATLDAVPLVMRDHQKKAIVEAVELLKISQYEPNSINLKRIEGESPSEFVARLRGEVMDKDPVQLFVADERELGKDFVSNALFLLERKSSILTQTQRDLFAALMEKVGQVCKTRDSKVNLRDEDIYAIVIDGEIAARRAYDEAH